MSWSGTFIGLFQRLLQRDTSQKPLDREPIDRCPHKLTREDVLRLIEDNGGPEGLDLSGQDLSWIDLSREVIRHEVEHRNHHTGSRPCWQNERNGGMNLRGVVFTNANLFGADLAYADLHRANLEGARLQAANLTKAWLRHTNFRDADLSGSDLGGALARLAQFERADMSVTDLTGTDFDEASLRGTSLYKALLSGTKLSRRELGDVILQEQPAELRVFLHRHHPRPDPRTVEIVIRTRQLEEARQVYAALKANFLETGNFEDASWAHIKERQMAKKTHHPKRARHYYADELSDNRALVSRGWWRFYLRHTLKWLLDWAAELTCGYGEKPLRTVYWAGVVLVIFPFLFRWSNGVVSDAGPMSWLDYFNYSFGAFTTFGFDRFQAITPLAQTLTSIEALLGISVLALLMFTLGNRISRS
jgi:uncharacterized protein YjbI with pentapeptide repeats